MKRFLLIIILLIGFQEMNAQYTEIINSKRPGFSESPYSVGTGVYQFEAGLFYKNTDDESLTAHPQTFGGEFLFRTSHFLDRLEINLNVAYQAEEVQNPFGNNYYNNDFSDVRLAAKYLVYQQEYADKSKEIRSWKARHSFDKKRLIPSVGIYASAGTNLLSKDATTNEEIIYRGAILLQNDFSENLVLITNLLVSDITSENIEYAYDITMTYAFDYHWSFFIENIGKYGDLKSPEYQIGTGIAYLFSPNLQIDASYRSNLFTYYLNNYVSIGASYRIDKHKDKIIEEGTEVEKEEEKEASKKGLFSKKSNKN